MRQFNHVLFIILFIFVFSKYDYKDTESSDPGYEELLKWGLKNNLNITKKIKFVKDKNTREYITKELIPEGEIILDIPPECMMNINSSLALLNSKKYRKAYYTYKEQDKYNKEVLKDEYHTDQAFMAYILYIVNHKKKSYEKNKNKFYEYYKPIYYMFEDNLDHLPFYFSSEQMRFFLNTSFGSVFEIFNKYINEEATIFEKKIFKKTVIFEEYLPYRIFTVQKTYEVDGVINLVPFLDYIKKSFKNNNCDFKIEDGHIIIKAKHKILPGEELIINPITISNQHRFIFFGETYDEILDKFQTFNVPTIIPHYITNKPITFDVDALGEKSHSDLIEIDFYKSMINIYRKFARTIQEDDTEEGACKLILKYLTTIRNNYDYIKNEDIRNAFYDKRDAENVKRILDGEKKFLERRISILKIYIKNLNRKDEYREDYEAEEVNDL